MKKVRVIHANDSKTAFGSHADRHEHIGKGQIGAEAFTRIVRHPKLKNIPFICETPVDKPGDDVRNIRMMRKLGRGVKPVVNADSWWDGLVRDRFQAVLELVLDAIADDYVTVEIIIKKINEWDGERDPESWAARSAAPVSRPEVIHALRELTREGYAQACIFNGHEAHRVSFRRGSACVTSGSTLRRRELTR